MYVRRIPPATVKTGTSTVTVSRKVSSAYARNVVRASKMSLYQNFEKDGAAAEALLDHLEALHVELDGLDALAASITALIDQLAETLAVLTGQDPDPTKAIGGPPVENAMMAKATLDTLAVALPDFELPDELEDTASAVASALAILKAEHEAVAERRSELDDVCRAATLHTLARAADKPTKITHRFEQQEDGSFRAVLKRPSDADFEGIHPRRVLAYEPPADFVMPDDLFAAPALARKYLRGLAAAKSDAKAARKAKAKAALATQFEGAWI